MKWLVAISLAAFIGCAPQVKAPDAYTVPFPDASPEIANTLLKAFTTTLKDLGITLTLEGVKAYRYEGVDDRAFLAATDRFYLDVPGYCPLERAFYYADNKTTLMTLAAKPNSNQVRAFIYDLATRPKLVFAFYFGTSRTPLKIAPCRTAGGI
jgi:hypothetical protein